MSVIKVLPDHVSNKIAAGEVIARPASVIKELVENSLDAGASKIIINTEKGGVKLISVTDDGAGMDADDALLCLEPHATSKIALEEDITNINTFGFRGEAIPSVASVSRFTLRTRKHDAIEGTEVVVQGGKFISHKPVGSAPGTEIIVRDLFFNTPARKKFLRAQATEEKHIHETLISMSLAYPAVSFELIIEGRMAVNTPGHDKLPPRLTVFFGKSFVDGMLPVGYSDQGVSVSGFIAKHGYLKSSRREQRVFVNGRAVEAFAVYAGIREGYGTLVPKGKYPPVILFLRMEPFMVDVNVHPAKKEVRFRQDRTVTSVVAEAVRMVLRTAGRPTAAVSSEVPLRSILQSAEVGYSLKNETPDFDTFKLDHRDPTETPDFPDFTVPLGRNIETRDQSEPPSNIDNQVEIPAEAEPIVPFSSNAADSSLDERGSSSQAQSSPLSSRPISEGDKQVAFPGSGPLNILGVLDDTYILATADSGLLVIDQHAAHERVLFERIIKQSKEGSDSQKLLIPITVEMARGDILFLEKNVDLLEEIGFEIDMFGQNTIMVRAIPAALPQEDIPNMLNDLIRDMIENDSKSGKKRNVDVSSAAMAACKQAVKGHDNLTHDEIRSLLKQMSECELPFSCPHGRPTIINIPIKELEKRFGRT